jgi:CBS domain containing-hemolysin-like protein
LLEDFQKNHKVMAVVLDEYGWVSWIVTLEDIIEEIFWEIRDETDKETEEIENKGTNIYEVDSDIRIEEVLSLFNLEFRDFGWNEDKFDWETLGYVLTDILERFPKKQEIVKLEILLEDEEIEIKHKEFLKFKILEINNGIIWKVEIRKN